MNDYHYFNTQDLLYSSIETALKLVILFFCNILF